MQRFNWNYRFRLRLKQLSGLLWLHEKLNRKPAILAYHGLVGQHQYPEVETYFLELEIFKSHLQYLRRNYHVVPLMAIINALKTGQAPPHNWIALTFDDGLASTITLALDLLNQYQFAWSLAVCPGLIDSQRSVWTYELAFFLWVCWQEDFLQVEYPKPLRLPTKTSEEKRQTLAAIRQICFQQGSHKRRRLVLDPLFAQLGKRTFQEAIARYDLLRLADWPQLEQIARQDVNILAHGAYHCPQNDQIEEEAQIQEFVAAQGALSRLWPDKTWGFALPHGLHNQRTKSLCEHYNFEYCLTSEEASLGHSANLMSLPRIDANIT